MQKIFPTLKKLFFELAVVFTGVFLAFQLNTFQEDKADKKIQIGYYHLILMEFQSNLIEIKYTKESITTYRDTLRNHIRQGRKPKIETLNNHTLDNNMFVIQSAFESGHLENLDPRFVANISSGSNYITRVSKRIDLYNQSMLAALQNNNWENELFYTKENQLKSSYEWMLNDLDYIVDYLDSLEKAIEEGAIPDINKIIQSSENKN